MPDISLESAARLFEDSEKAAGKCEGDQKGDTQAIRVCETGFGAY